MRIPEESRDRFKRFLGLFSDGETPDRCGRSRLKCWYFLLDTPHLCHTHTHTHRFPASSQSFPLFQQF